MSNLMNVLLNEHLITPEQLEDAKDKQIGAKLPLHEILIEMGYIDEDTLVKAVSKVFNIEIVNLSEQPVDPEILKLLPYDNAKKYGAFPLNKQDGKLVVAMSNPQDIIAVENIHEITGEVIKPVLCKKSEVNKCIEEYYLLDDHIYDLLKNINEDASIGRSGEIIMHQDMGSADVLKDENSPVIRLVHLIILDAVKLRASDIHIEPYETYTAIRYRVDGYLKQIMKVPVKMHSSLGVRIKVLADLDIAEIRKPQDGRSRVTINNQFIDLRISTVPTFHGEKIVIRLLDTKAAKKTLDDIGFDKEELAVFKELINKPQGIILVTGPTGSGKTSTIYAALDYVKSETKNIITIEDPIEYLIEGVNQIQVNRAKDVTFANGLRSILRQDPNVILIGEIRDSETAEIAFRSSLTGHLVFSTLHTNDAVSSIVRLKDIGLEPYLIGSSILVILAQRLVRVICPKCKKEYEPEERLKKKFDQYLNKYSVKTFYKGEGCEKCSFSGFKGRTALYEMLVLNDKLRQMIAENAQESDIVKEAVCVGMRFLAESGAIKVKNGLTTLNEVEFVCNVQEEAHEIPLDVMPSEAELLPTDEKSVQSQGEKETVLIVDDEKDIRQILSLRLTKAGFHVIQAENGAEAIEKAIKEKPHLIIMDVMMPKMDGFEATRALRSGLETANVPLIMLTAKKEKACELEGLRIGADDYITKPFDHEKLVSRVRVLLRRAQGRFQDRKI